MNDGGQARIVSAATLARAARRARLLCAPLGAALLAACATTPGGALPEGGPVAESGPAARTAPAAPAAAERSTRPPQAARRGAYYKDDGPGENPPPDLDRIADAEPRLEPLHRAANNPYSVFGADYAPMRALAPFRQSGIGSWYGRRFQGLPTSSGEPYDMYAMTAAHPTLPIPSYARVTNTRNQRSAIVRVNDRGPFHSGRVIDLSFAAANRLGYAEVGSAPVEVELLLPQEIARLSKERALASAGSVPSAGARAAAAADRPLAAVAAQAEAGLAAQVPVTSAQVPVAAAQVPVAAAQVPVAAVPVPVAAALVRPASAAADPAAQAARARIWVQLGAYSQRANAESMRARALRTASALAESVEVLQGDTAWRVQVGPYLSRGEAAAAADRLRQALRVEPLFVIRQDLPGCEQAGQGASAARC